MAQGVGGGTWSSMLISEAQDAGTILVLYSHYRHKVYNRRSTDNTVVYYKEPPA